MRVYDVYANRCLYAIAVTNFDEYVQAGNAFMESYPRQCHDGVETFVEYIGNELEKVEIW